MTRVRNICAAMLLTAPALLPAQDVPQLLAAFSKASPAAQEQALAGLRAALQEHDALTAKLLALAADAAGPRTERTRRRAEHQKASASAREALDEVVPADVRYVFGVAVIEPVGAVAKGRRPADASRHRREACIEQALRGMVPGTDAALAELESRLDLDAAGDRFAAFLHSWRNGRESFYEALDRTAGTPDSVFFYDAMLSDFASAFAGKEATGSRRLASGLQARHDALQDGFLAYRQYRGFREAVAYSLVLPPATPMPARLARYEQAVQGAYSLRQQVVMLCDVFDGDPVRVVDAIVASAPPLPDPIWSAAYDPYTAWNALFARHLPRMIELAGHSDELLRRATAARAAVAVACASMARDAVQKLGDEATPGR